MDLTKFPVIQLVRSNLDWAAQRQRVLAENVAQADTPDFRPSDVKEPDFKRLLNDPTRRQPVRVAMTDPGHMPGTLPDPSPFDARTDRRTFETELGGNAVVLEEQMRKIGQTKSRYIMASNLFERNVRMLKAAIGRDRG